MAAAPAPPPPGPSPEALRVLAELGRDLAITTDGEGRISWANRRFAEAVGWTDCSGRSLLELPPEGAAGTASRLLIASVLSSSASTTLPATLALRGPGGTISVELRSARVDATIVWTMQDTTRLRDVESNALRQSELLELAQEFGRLGVWEREIPSGKGRWDRHVFSFWGLDPTQGTPDYAQAIERIHPADRARMSYLETTRRAGRYAQRYRVVHPGGRTRLIHSQWEVKNGPLGIPDRALGIMVDDSEAFEAARALISINHQLEMAIALGNIAVWRHDLASNRIHYNASTYAWIGKGEATDGVPIDEVRAMIHPDDLPLVTASAMEVLRTGAPNDFEARYLRPDGSWRYILTRRALERDANGAPVAFIGVALDVSERNAQLKKARDLGRRLEAASRASRVGLWATSVQSRQTDWNAQMFELFDAFKSPKVPTLGEWLQHGVHADDRERVARRTKALLQAGTGPFEMEFRSPSRVGQTRWIAVRCDVDPDAQDERRLLGVAMDVSEHHAALDALRTASERTGFIARQAGMGLWESDLDGRHARWDEQMFILRGLLPRAEPPDREERLASVHPDDIKLILDSLELNEAATMAAPSAYEFRIRTPDGGYRWIASRSAVIGDELGQPARRVGVNWDVTESKSALLARQQAALAEREVQAKSQFLSRMSHELRTPLNAVLGFTQLLELEARQGERPAELAKLAHIRAAGDHLLALIDDVLELSGLEAGELRLALQPVELERVAAEAISLLAGMAAERQVEVRVDGHGGVARADPTRLRQVLINLLSNAIKYNRVGGSVVVQTRAGADEVLVSVRDNGRGLTSEQIGGLFEPFNRFGADQDGIQGTGIGLTIVKAIVDGMRGRIEVQSEPGRGACFVVALPSAQLLPAAGGDRAAAAEPPASVAGTGEGVILYIEDNHVNVLLVAELINIVGHVTCVAEPSGRAGIERARTLRPDLILVDLQLPDIDGFEVLRRLRADPATAQIPCIALSANAMPEDIERGRAAGFADYWTKPIDFTAFIAAMQRLFPPVAEPVTRLQVPAGRDP